MQCCLFLFIALPYIFEIAAGEPHLIYERAFESSSPEESDPESPPTSIKALPRSSVNPFSGKLGTTPNSCKDFGNPSNECLTQLFKQKDGVVAFGGGRLKFDGEHGCDSKQIGKIEGAAWDALTLAQYANKKPTSAKWISTWKAWIGPDYSSQETRILDNLNRVADFKERNKFDIIMSCKDSEEISEKAQEGKRVGGYARTYKGWFGTYYYITLCPIFFNLDTLDEKHELIEQGLRNGDTTYASQANWQKHLGQYFLHEMMHLDSVGQPHIEDEYIDPERDGRDSKRAYGPRGVYKLAQRPLNQGGGAKRASTNADSYAWLANSLFFYDLTGYFPEPPSYKGVSVTSAEELQSQDIFPVHLGNISDTRTNSEVESIVSQTLNSMDTDKSSASGILPKPSCSSNGNSFSRKDVMKHVEDFCSQKNLWDVMIAGPISMGKPKTKDGKTKSYGVYDSYDINKSKDKFWLDVSFTTSSCIGSFKFTKGSTDWEKKTNCMKNFEAILDGCGQSGTIKGGKMETGCGVYTASVGPKSPNKDQFTDVGSFECTDTDISTLGSNYNGPLKGTCVCWFSKYPDLKDTFTKGKGKKCNGKDVSQSALLNN